MMNNFETLKEKNLFLKKKIAEANVTFKNHENQKTDELNVLKDNNKEVVEFVNKNHETLQVST